MDWLLWFTEFENAKPLALVIFFTSFCVVLYYLYGSRRRGEQIETFKNIPFFDEMQDEKEKQS